jgi:hypothetical protein
VKKEIQVMKFLCLDLVRILSPEASLQRFLGSLKFKG